MNEVPPPMPQAAEVAAWLVDEVVASLVNVRIYASNHPRVQLSFAAVQGHLRTLADCHRENPVRIGCVDDVLVFRQRPLLGASLAAARLIELLGQWGAGGLEFDDQTTSAELHEFFSLLQARREGEQTFLTCNTTLLERQCRHARLLPPYVDGAGGAKGQTAAGLKVAVQFYQRIIDLLQRVTIGVCRGGRIDFGPVQAQAEELLNRLAQNDGPMLGLARQDQYDAFTFGHSLRVAVLCLNFVRTLTDDRALLIRIGTAALLHDVGKSLVPFELLQLQRRLDPDELAQMNRHPQLGAEILLDHHDSDPLAIAGAFGHHLTGSGRGYPRTLHPHRITLVTEVIKICDVYEALTAARPYKQPMSPVRAYRVMLAMGDKLHRGLLRRFIAVNGIFPVGQQVVLQSGEHALVRQQGADPSTPLVELLTDGHGVELPADARELIDLGAVDCCHARSILAELADGEPVRETSTR